MTPRSENPTRSRIVFGAILALLLSACGSLVDMGGNSNGVQRRIYVNDAATNDSLRTALLKGGVYFVMQPGKQYSLKVDGGVAGDFLQVLSATGNVYNFWKNVTGTLAGSSVTYTLQDSTVTGARYVLAYLRSASGTSGTQPTKVRLVPTNPGLPTTVKVRLVLVRTLTGLSSESTKQSFANAFLTELDTIYSRYGIDLETSYEILEPNSPPLTVDFTSTTDLPAGARIPNTVYLYLVEKITLDGKANPDGIILGFAPREAFDLNTSEVVLSVEKTPLSAVAVATTAAHEMGHFLGLRHTTATQLDQRGDNDLSNFDDGFTGTGLCTGLTKRMAVGPQSTLQVSQGKPFCLRIMADNCPASCTDRTNLMFAYQCDGVTQKTLVTEQSTFVRQNMSLFQR